MDEEDLRAIILRLQDHLREVGAADLAEEIHYVDPDEESGDSRLLPPLERLTRMLEAFERFLAVQDRAIYVDAMRRMQTDSDTAGPLTATVLLNAERGEAPVEISLAEAPDLTDLRRSIASLIERLRIVGPRAL